MSAGPVVRTRVLPALAAAGVAAALAASGWYGWRELAARPIAHVTFAGDLARIASADLDAFARGWQGQPAGSVSLAAVRESARRIPWVRDAAVRRRFPDGLEVTLEAHQALARWNGAALVSTRGDVFTAPYTGTLPRFIGPDGAAALMVHQYAPIARALAPLASPVAELRLSPRGAWQVALASGLTLELGRADIEPRIERFVAAWPGLAARGVETRHVDLRYANGFALRRVSDSAPVSTSSNAAQSREAAAATQPKSKKR
jgi:cell division protein FtsQ